MINFVKKLEAKAAIFSLGSESSNMLNKAMLKYFSHVDFIDIRGIEVNLSGKEQEVLYNGDKLESYDCAYIKGSFKYAELLQSLTTAYLEKTYMPIPPAAFTEGHHKLLTQLRLQQNKVPMPTTYIASSAKAAKQILEKMNYPIIMKLPQGTQGKGVMYADSYAAASSMLDTLDTLKQPFIIQEYVDTNGVDIRAIVVGDRVVASMKRIADQNEQRSNIHAGGKGEPIILDYEAKKIAVDSAKALNLDVCAVDILESPKGPVVIEINLSPGLQGITEATKIDVADEMAKFFYHKTKERVDLQHGKDRTYVLEELGIEDKAAPKVKQIITAIDMRGNRILLPELVTKITKFDDKEELVLKAGKGKFSMTNLKL
ncbi:MAG: RimK family alpha-L-glutamate ligase [Candidatus Woesearchaeota archaeon]|nr:RimK family alpha-L-glutamate ligase [Candidatus Woesearchaeota archaeon]MDP7323721.1 RimK family alpha-L-glutamate ligase [Candidatus Woesearchaeota archaeon]MDP7457477.1 RimK family alpha-L-glutamate ligase [Candidatus Woesearchaeota archaeon]